MVAIVTGLAGFPGDVSRRAGAVVDSVGMGSGAFTMGQGVAFDAAKGVVVPMKAGDTADKFAGVLVREFGMDKTPVSAIGVAQPDANHPVAMLRKGYANVKVSGAPVEGQPAFLQLVVEGDIAAGQFTATASGTAANSLKLSNVTFAVTGVDENSVGEIFIA